jgi:signal transduction histidine kinase/DNA-binding CsgD family transcriptional regulator
VTDASPFLSNSDQLPALAVSAELSSCDVEESAWILHRWLAERYAHVAVAVTLNGSGAALSQWIDPSFELPVDWSGDHGRPVVAASGHATSSSVTIVVVPAEDRLTSGARLEGALAALARVLAARIGRLPSEFDTARLALAHALAGERDRVTHQLTDHFAQYLHTIVGRLGGESEGDACARVRSATSVASRALVELRETRRPVWRQARRLDDAFGVLEGDLGELARAAGIQLELTLVAPHAQILPNTVLDAAATITRATVLNVVEHAAATRARVAWRVDGGELVASIVDDGSGFDPQCAGGGGLASMRRRAEGLGGTLEVAATPGWGTRVLAHLPLQFERSAPADESASAVIGTLSDRELAVLRLMAVGYRNREIAAELFISTNTVKFHVSKILEKLDARTRAEAAAVAFAARLQPAHEPAAAAA